MLQKVKGFIVNQLERKQPIPSNTAIDQYRYLDLGHIDSLGVMKFVILIEQKFDIEIGDSDMESDDFRSVGGLAALVCEKLCAKALFVAREDEHEEAEETQ